ncbi:twin-arginine translocation signal domain-containing protein [Candidatus Chloroploca asiatica]|uniref:twin-arginine translocation signal domain-containing protein n=1 Tax=Candidatus Chloroploca asiatica TaxID=1506545 RepID=UPI0011416F6D|nr:twin-arginine translocation signal domain-containing protein [Candidatus Chloroploca asiatica]
MKQTRPDQQGGILSRRRFLRLAGALAGGSLLAACASRLPPAPTETSVLPRLATWPAGRRAAVAFTFDWETAMGGLVHSRSIGDPNVDQDYLLRARRMREGLATTMAVFAPLAIRATYYATGYNFLLGNREQRQFLGNPIFPWATQANGWTSDRWTTTPWFADDPFGTVESHPEWYFGDLIEPLREAGHTIESHTFSHFHGGLVDPVTWRLDLQTWNNLAAERGVPPARSLAFPWSSSAGMSDASWDELELAGITSVTRLSNQAQYSLWEVDQDGVVLYPRPCWLPGREGRMMACPDFYLTVPRTSLALVQIERAVETGGMIDFWAHTEEVVSPEQIASWQRVAARVANDIRLWVAPLDELTTWYAAIAEVRVEADALDAQRGELHLQLTNPTRTALPGLTLHVPAATRQVFLEDVELETLRGRLSWRTAWWPAVALVTLDLPAETALRMRIVM